MISVIGWICQDGSSTAIPRFYIEPKMPAYREVTAHYLLKPGKYVVKPTTEDGHPGGHYLLRCVTELNVNADK